MKHIFISYSHKDKEYVHKLQETLQAEGFEVWIDDRIDYGTTWPHVIQERLDSCVAFIVVMTENAYKSEWVQNEVTRARRKKKPFFALLLSGDTWLSFEAIQYEDVTDGKLPSKKFYESLARAMEKGATSPPPSIKRKFPVRYVVAFFIIAAMIWGGSLAIPAIGGRIPTAKATATLRPVSTVAPLLITKTIEPSQSPTKIFTFTATSLPSQITDIKGVTMRLVPAGEFTMGSNNGDNDEKPVHKVYLNAYYMDIYEVTNALYRACVEAGGCTAPRRTSSYKRIRYYGDSKYDDYPVISVDWNQARAYCEWRGGSLPTEAQWEKAARGTDGRTYPWGEGIDSTRANYNLNVGDTTEVGSYERGKSPYGIYDLTGNVWEWVADWYNAYPGNAVSDSRYGTTYRVMRGGAWGNSAEFNLRASLRFGDTPDGFFDSVGFRCASSAP